VVGVVGVVGERRDVLFSLTGPERIVGADKITAMRIAPLYCTASWLCRHGLMHH
jgi:hypothetical protein